MVSSITGVEFGDFSMDSHQVTGDPEARAGSFDLFSYSNEFERDFEWEITPEDFNILSLLYESDNDGSFLEPVEEDSHKQETGNLLPHPITIQATDRIQWTCELQSRFLRAIDLLGGPEKSTPSSILHLMNVKGLTLNHVKSHLQTHRNALNQELPKSSEMVESTSVTSASEDPNRSYGSASVAVNLEDSGKATGSASVVPSAECPSGSRTAKKRSSGEQDASEGTLDKKIKHLVTIEEVLEAQNHYLKLLRAFTCQQSGNNQEASNVEVASNLFQQQARHY